jgi:hypothetical protein
LAEQTVHGDDNHVAGADEIDERRLHSRRSRPRHRQGERIFG